MPLTPKLWRTSAIAMAILVTVADARPASAFTGTSVCFSFSIGNGPRYTFIAPNGMFGPWIGPLSDDGVYGAPGAGCGSNSGASGYGPPGYQGYGYPGYGSSGYPAPGGTPGFGYPGAGYAPPMGGWPGGASPFGSAFGSPSPWGMPGLSPWSSAGMPFGASPMTSPFASPGVSPWSGLGSGGLPLAGMPYSGFSPFGQSPLTGLSPEYFSPPMEGGDGDN